MINKEIGFIKCDKNITNNIFNNFNNLYIKSDGSFLYEKNDGNLIREISYDSKKKLNVFDQTIFFTILYLSHINYNKSKTDDNFDCYEENNFNQTSVFNCKRIITETTFYDILKISSINKDNYIKKIKDSLNKIQRIMYKVYDENGNESSGGFINYCISKNKIKIHLFESFVESFKKNFNVINLDDRIKIGLKNSTSLKLNDYFCSFINENSTQKIKTDTIIKNIFCGNDEIYNNLTSKQLSKFRERIKKDMKLINDKTRSFEISEINGKGKESFYIIKRLKVKI